MTESSFPLTGFGSTAVHSGHEQDPRYAHLVPIYASSTYVYDSAEQGMHRFNGSEPGYIYSRWGNPTFTEAENKIAALETFGLTDSNGQPLQAKGLLHASGMSAISTLMIALLQKGDKILSHYSLYAGTEELMSLTLNGLGIAHTLDDLSDLNKVEEHFKKDPAIRLLYLETPANPTMQCVDLEALTKLAHQYHVLVACDNTFATPYLQQPFKYGVDYIVHSTTKFLNGHGTSIGGILLGRDLERMKGSVGKAHKLLGGNSNPFDAFLLINGLKTLELRMDRHCDNAESVARFLESHPAVAKVNYTGLTSHKEHALASRQMKRHGGMLSFELKGGLDAGVSCINQLKMCTRTVSLGTCDTLLCHPASMTHFAIPKEKRLQYGITDGLIRMSVGIENEADILRDLEQALA
jgi:methionine-gamma-lyase